MASDRQWAAATSEHDEALGDFIGHVQRVQPDHWWLSTKAGKWSPAEEALHVVIAYEIGSGAVAAPDGDGGMRMLVSPARAWLSRHLLLPLILMTKQFPRGAKAPAEVVPSLPEAATLSAAVVSARLVRSAREAVDALRRSSERATPRRFVHAYFGPLDSLTTLRLLSAHTRHHTRHFARRHVR